MAQGRKGDEKKMGEKKKGRGSHIHSPLRGGGVKRKKRSKREGTQKMRSLAKGGVMERVFLPSWRDCC